ncbi:MAG: hypothetical protein B7733_06515 [Myxococcales bacterium FL481]|nr:MAG: hypothetical protein B7733_06515 [Myxococcales bacterium FL481]
MTFPSSRSVALTLAGAGALWGASARPATAAPSPGKTLQSRTDGNLGLGVTLGQPTGLSGKYFLSPQFAVAGAFGWGYQYGGRVHADFAWHPGTAFDHDLVDVVPYVGVGAGLGLFHHQAHPWRRRHPEHDVWNHSHGAMFLRLPVLGAAAHWQDLPLDTFVEFAWAPGVIVGNHGPLFSGWAVDWAIGARWYF